MARKRKVPCPEWKTSNAEKEEGKKVTWSVFGVDVRESNEQEGNSQSTMSTNGIVLNVRKIVSTFNPNKKSRLLAQSCDLKEGLSSEMGLLV